jgi:2-polyprenyl-6-methoxyphenol hydroxylase-like FAD-dependent oxidoreductase
MHDTDVAIVGGGLAGSTAAAMLGRAGLRAVLIDPHGAYPPDFRCEKLDGVQVALLRKTGLAPAVLRAATLDAGVWVVRFGRVVEKRSSDQHGILYESLVNTIRAQIPDGTGFIQANVTSVSTSADCQRLTLSDGRQVTARLVALASGLSRPIAAALGIGRVALSRCHSVAIGFDVVPVGRPAFEFPALTYWAARITDKMAYLTLFPVPGAMRANLMVYRDMRDPWLERMRTSARDALCETMPRLASLLGDFTVTAPVRIRPADLFVSTGFRRAGMVLVGDAFATSCPAAGTGVGKVFTDVERLCNVHVPAWLATSGMSEKKIDAFYDDRVKRACDAASLAKAYWLRSLSMGAGPTWRARRWARFVKGVAATALRSVRARPQDDWLAARVAAPHGDASRSHTVLAHE